MGNIESVDGQCEMKHHLMPLKVPMPDPAELEERFAIVLVSIMKHARHPSPASVTYQCLCVSLFLILLV